MDINPSKKSRLLYQRGDQNTRGVVDLRCFAKPRRAVPAPAKAKTFYEIRKADSYTETVRKGYLKGIEESRQIIAARAAALEEREQRNCALVSSDADTGKNYAEQNPQEEFFGEEIDAPAEKFPEKVSDKEFSPADQERTFNFPSFVQMMPAVLSPERSGAYSGKNFMRFAAASLMIPAIIFSFSFTQSQFEKKGKVLGESTVAYENLKTAAQYAFASDFASTAGNFEAATMNFAQARETINSIGFGIGETVAGLPLNTPLSTARNLASAGENLSLAGKEMSSIFEKISAPDKNGFEGLLEIEDNLKAAAFHINEAEKNLEGVEIKHIPTEMRDKISLAKETLPIFSNNFQRLAEDYPSIIKMLGGQRSQKYLLLFENNSEMRATGGFIGSYGILDIENGKMKSLMIDGIFNPDGQLKEKIVPPMPIQKISASWSMHDSNWFADFPTSAKKTALLYEKTGGPTVDGVIAVTPETIKKLLEITGPIEMPAYGTTITAENFVSHTQNQVENLYDKKENKPKKILSDLAPILLERLFQEEAGEENRTDRMIKVIQKTEESLKEKHIIIYHRDESIENMLQKRGWGGEITQNVPGDYLAVINSNINGYKTDAVIEESINMHTEISEDGTVVNMLTIRRKHNGGNSEYDWYNRVNANFLRVYVPKGSILLEASGNTAEEYEPPMDYSNFTKDPDVEAIEKTIKIDPESGTQVFEEAGKTVFGNWVYVSPQEEVVLKYKYQLPFKIDFESDSRSTDLYSAFIQKQAGSVGSLYSSHISLPEGWRIAWKTENLQDGDKVEKKLEQDLIYGAVFLK